jgi:hypothetical protein
VTGDRPRKGGVDFDIRGMRSEVEQRTAIALYRHTSGYFRYVLPTLAGNWEGDRVTFCNYALGGRRVDRAAKMHMVNGNATAIRKLKFCVERSATIVPGYAFDFEGGPERLRGHAHRYD